MEQNSSPPQIEAKTKLWPNGFPSRHLTPAMGLLVILISGAMLNGSHALYVRWKTQESPSLPLMVLIVDVIGWIGVVVGAGIILMIPVVQTIRHWRTRSAAHRG